MHNCGACHKFYSSAYNLKKHLQRQPLCERWMQLTPGIKDYVDDRFGALPISDTEQKDLHIKCFICGTTFANPGNLNRHLDSSVICSKWSMYRDLKPLQSYLRPHSRTESQPQSVVIDADADDPSKSKTPAQEDSCFEAFNAPAYSLSHVIWNIFVIDKQFTALPIFDKILKENNVQYILAILPSADEYQKHVLSDVDHDVMVYEGHDLSIDCELFDEHIRKIEEYRKERGNVFVFCNNGYQRSIPFLCYYLTKFHGDEVPDVTRAIDLVLPQLDKANYAALRDDYIKRVQEILPA